MSSSRCKNSPDPVKIVSMTGTGNEMPLPEKERIAGSFNGKDVRRIFPGRVTMLHVLKQMDKTEIGVQTLKKVNGYSISEESSLFCRMNGRVSSAVALKSDSS